MKTKKANLAALLDSSPYLQMSLSANTQLNYGLAWNGFKDWCKTHGQKALPASKETLIRYMTELADTGKKPSTINLKLSAIAHFHEVNGFDNPKASIFVRKTMSGIRRALGTRPAQKAPLMADDLRKIHRALTHKPIDTRNWAILTVGFAGAFRISEVLNLRMDHLAWEAQGVKILMSRSKTDQDGRGQIKFIGLGQHEDTCPVRSLQRWLEVRGPTPGPVFCHIIPRWGKVKPTARLTTRNTYRELQKIFARAGLPEKVFSCHSLRAGFVTSARAAGLADADIMRVTGHKAASTLSIYDRRPDEAQLSVTTKVGL